MRLFGHIFNKKPFLAYIDDPEINDFFGNIFTPKTQIDVDIPAVFLRPDGTQMFGSGNTKHNALVEVNHKLDIGAYFKDHARQGNDIDGYFIGDGIELNVPKGHQRIDPAFGTTQERLDRDMNSFDFGFNTNTDGGPGMTQEQFHKKGGVHVIKIDTDPTDGYDPYLLYSAWRPDLSTGSSGVVFFGEGGELRISDMSGDAYTAANSWQLLFLRDKIDIDQSTPGIQQYNQGAGEFDIELESYAPPPSPFLVGIVGTPAVDLHVELNYI